MSFTVGLIIGFLLGLAVQIWQRKSWRDEPPSEKQLNYADDLGISVPPGCTKGQVSDLIDAAKRK